MMPGAEIPENSVTQDATTPLPDARLLPARMWHIFLKNK